MVRYILLSVLLCLLFDSCGLRNDSVTREAVYGLYKRPIRGGAEYLCLQENSTYLRFEIRNGIRKELGRDKWDFAYENGESRIGLDNFENEGISAPILFSSARETIVIHMDADDPSFNFFQTDSASCKLVMTH